MLILFICAWQTSVASQSHSPITKSAATIRQRPVKTISDRYRDIVTTALIRETLWQRHCSFISILSIAPTKFFQTQKIFSIIYKILFVGIEK